MWNKGFFELFMEISNEISHRNIYFLSEILYPSRAHNFIYIWKRINLPISISVYIRVGPRRTFRSGSSIRLYSSRSHECCSLGTSGDLGFRARMDLFCAPGATWTGNVRISFESSRISRILDQTIAGSYRYVFNIFTGRISFSRVNISNCLF